MDIAKTLALDIETTGLNPDEHEIVAVGIATTQSSRAYLGDEGDILRKVEARICSAPAESGIVTWNGEEFDLPFLRTRYEVLGMTTSLRLRSRGIPGKYGKPRYEATWSHLSHVDIAPLFATRAKELGVKWSLKPVARAILGVEPVEVDNRGVAIEAMEADALSGYVLSDAKITLALASYLAARGQLIQSSPQRAG